VKAIVYTTYGSPDVLQFNDVETPTPKDNEVLVKVHAASANPLDWHLMRAEPFLARLENGLLKPKNTKLGADVAGRVEAVGRHVTQFQVGDDVFGAIPIKQLGGFAEYVCVQQDTLALKPAKMTFEQAAAVPIAALTALQGLRDTGQLQPGQKYLINGASGGVGTFAVQIAKSFGTEVTGVCSTRNLDMARSLGADHVIDYMREDFTRNGQQYDLILAVNGYRSISDFLRALKPGGNYVVAGGSMRQLIQAALQGRQIPKVEDKKTHIVSLVQSQTDLFLLKELLESRKVIPVIDGCYPLHKTADAFWYFEKEHAKGKVIITM